MLQGDKVSTYFYLINHTKKEKVNFDGLVKSHNVRNAPGLHMAFINYMFEHQGDHVTILDDTVSKGFFGLKDWDKYKVIDLKSDYEFIDEEIKEEVLRRHIDAIAV
jgi:hypothetical protein